MSWEPQAEQEFQWHEWSENSSIGRLLTWLRPEAGWASVPLTILLCMIMAWSITDARWILGRNDYTSFLIQAAFLASVWGWISSRLAMRRWAAHIVGALIGAFVLSVMTGYAIQPTASDPIAAFDATAAAVTNAYLDLVWYRLLTTQQVGHFALFLGVLVWGTAQAASYDVFGHRRPVNAVLLLAVVFVANMSITANDQFGGLVIFSVVALTLLLQTHAADERAAWIRHRIWRPRSTETPHLRGGMAFASIAVMSSLILTSLASSAPLADAWPTVADNFRGFADWAVRYLPQTNNSRFAPVGDFPTTAVIQGSWRPDNTTVFTVRVDDRNTTFHWRMISYDVFNKTTWAVSSQQQKVNVAADAALENGTQDNPPQTGRVEHKFTVTLVDKGIRQLIAPNEPTSVDAPTTVTLAGTGGQHVAQVESNSKQYDVTALVPSYATDGITQNKLRVAGTNYPAGLKQMYTQGTEFLGTDARNLLAEIEATAPGGAGYTNSYDLANAMVAYFHSDRFSYNTDINNQIQQSCGGISIADCFARIRQGFCQQYATTMTMLLRLADVPARYVQGYLPGSLDQYSPIYTVTGAAKHAWVEAYFPGYGWLEFDPTGSVGVNNIIPAGAKVSPGPTASPSPSGGNETDAPKTKRPGPDTGQTGTTTPTDPGFPYIPAALLVAAIAIAAVLTLWFRRIRPAENPDVVYRGITRMAGWIGYKPQPTQTVYEYIGSLSDVLPQTRPHLEAVANAKVEVTYGRRALGEERLRALTIAGRKIRVALMRLAIRRPPIPFKRRKRRR